MKLSHYLLLLLLLSPLTLLFYTHGSKTYVLIPGEPEKLMVSGDGTRLKISSNIAVDANISRLTQKGSSEIEKVTISPDSPYEYKLSNPTTFEIHLVSDSVAEVTIALTGIPEMVYFFILILIILNIIVNRSLVLDRFSS